MNRAIDNIEHVNYVEIADYCVGNSFFSREFSLWTCECEATTLYYYKMYVVLKHQNIKQLYVAFFLF